MLPGVLEQLEAAVAEMPGHPARKSTLANAYHRDGRVDEAIVLVEQAVEQAKTVFANDLFSLEQVRGFFGAWFCSIKEYERAEREFRWILSRQNSNTLAALVNGQPPCKEHFQHTDEYQQLEKDFGHYSNGTGTP